MRPLKPRRVVPPLPPLRELGTARRVGDDPCPEFSPGAQDRLTLGQVLFAQETYPTSDPKDYRLGNCYFHQDLQRRALWAGFRPDPSKQPGAPLLLKVP